MALALRLPRKQFCKVLMSPWCQGRDSSKLLKASEEIVREEQCEKNWINIKVADVSDYEAIYRAIHEAFHWRPVDILVCNAGVTKISYLEQVPIEKVATTVGTNLTGTLYTFHATHPLMEQRSSHCNGSDIVLMGSLASLVYQSHTQPFSLLHL
ncbi:hypothetical protein SUGI_0097300 [Cryptomeria japonica]|nr:hypothetical protein SUGI_0097300 [Cryptomeria japonica]